MFVAEAPGRMGADRTGVPLCGDRTGDNFEALLGNIGWRREQVFITNAVLCNPRQEDGNNGTPTSDEIANCSAYLEMVLALVGPEVIVTLGATALDALEVISPHGIDLQKGVARLVRWRGIRLFPLYHPGPRATIHRSLAKQRSDFMLLAKVVHPVRGLITQKKPSARAKPFSSAGASVLQQVVQALLELGGRMTYFKLTKLLYLVDLLSLRKLGRMVASDIYLRQVDGPWPPNLDKTLSAMQGYEVRRFLARKTPMVAPGPSPRFEVQLNDGILEIIAEVYGKYGSLTNSDIKTAVYRTDPMRLILREERKGKDVRNKPVLYKDKTGSNSLK
jgi:uracil-DNA glycosylase family 4